MIMVIVYKDDGDGIGNDNGDGISSDNGGGIGIMIMVMVIMV